MFTTTIPGNLKDGEQVQEFRIPQRHNWPISTEENRGAVQRAVMRYVIEGHTTKRQIAILRARLVHARCVDIEETIKRCVEAIA